MAHPLEAAKAGLTSPRNDEDQAGANGLVSLKQIQNLRADSALSAPMDQAAVKRIATLRARAALIGAMVIDSHDDLGRRVWILTRWSLTRAFASLDDLEALLNRMGAPA